MSPNTLITIQAVGVEADGAPGEHKASLSTLDPTDGREPSNGSTKAENDRCECSLG